MANATKRMMYYKAIKVKPIKKVLLALGVRATYLLIFCKLDRHHKSQHQLNVPGTFFFLFPPFYLNGMTRVSSTKSPEAKYAYKISIIFKD